MSGIEPMPASVVLNSANFSLISALIVACAALLQATIGVWTLLLKVPIELGLAHQAGALAVFAAGIYHFWIATGAQNAVARQPAAKA